MSWMERNFDKRVDPRRLVDGAQSVVSVIHNYYDALPQPAASDRGLISRYAWGADYHKVLRKKLANLMSWLHEQLPGANGRAFADSAPVMDKAWAQRAGLGWIGKNANLLNRGLGSFFFLGELIVDVALTPDEQSADHCGSCTRCIDACPTDAIFQPYVVDANRCISYLTIEHREDDIPEETAARMGRWLFGCDICQDVCPWNKFSRPTTESRFTHRQGIRDRSLEEWSALTEKEFDERFAGSAIRRTGFEGFKRNVRIASANAGTEED